MRFLLTTQPGRAGLAPLVVLAGALESAGHDVAIAGSPSFLPAVEEAGFEALPAGLDWLASDPAAAFHEVGGMDGATLDAFLRFDVLAGPAAAATFADLAPLARGWQADLLIHDATELGTPLAAEATGLAHVTIGLSPVPPAGILADGVGERLEALRADVGLRPDPHLERLWPALLTAYPPSFEAWPPEFGGSRVRSGPFSGPDLTRVAVRPLVPAGVGDPPRRDGHALLVAVPPGGTLATTLWDSVGGQSGMHLVAPGAAPDGVSVAEAAGVDALIGLAEPGPTMAALLAGVPQLLLPGGAQARAVLAHRVAAGGAGLALGPQADRAAVAAAIDALLEEPLFTANAHRIGRELAALPGLEETVALLEQAVR